MCLRLVKLWLQFSLSSVLFVAIILSNPPPYSFPPNVYLTSPIFAPVPLESQFHDLKPQFGSIPSHLIGGVYLRFAPHPWLLFFPAHFFFFCSRC